MRPVLARNKSSPIVDGDHLPAKVEKHVVRVVADKVARSTVANPGHVHDTVKRGGSDRPLPTGPVKTFTGWMPWSMPALA